jgi:hypothetical protein
MKWNYTSTINRMGEETKILSNESIDIPSHEHFLTPILIIRKSEETNIKFSIKLNFGGVELSNNSNKEKCIYETTCYRKCCGCYSSCDCYIKKYIIRTSSNKFRIKFDNDKPLIFDNHISGVSTITFSNEFIEQMKGKNKMIIEIEDVIYGKLWYEFNIEGLESICKENDVYTFRTPIEKMVTNVNGKTYNSTEKSNNGFYIWLIYGIIIFLSIFFIVYLNHKEETIDTTTYNNDVYKPSPGAWDDLSTMNKKETIKKKVKVPKREKIIKEKYTYEEDEFIKPIEPTPTYSEKEMEMIGYLKTKFPNYTEEQIGKIVKSNNEYTKYNDDIPTYVVSSVRPKKTENNDSNVIAKNDDKLNDYSTTNQVKKKGFLKRLFSKN